MPARDQHSRPDPPGRPRGHLEADGRRDHARDQRDPGGQRGHAPHQLEVLRAGQHRIRHHAAERHAWYSSYGSDFNYDFHATLDDRVAPVLLHLRTQEELATEKGAPWSGGPWTDEMNGEEMPGISTFLRDGDEVFHTYSTFGRGIEDFHNCYRYLDLTVLGRQEEWEEPKGRAEPLGIQVGGPSMPVPDQYDV